MTAVLMATNVGLNLAPQVDTCEMFWPKFRGLGQRYFSKQQIPGGSAFKTVWWAWLRGVGTLVLCPCRAGYHSSKHALCQSPPGQSTWQVDAPQVSPLWGLELVARHSTLVAKFPSR